jgi:hypothetical protein
MAAKALWFRRSDIKKDWLDAGRNQISGGDLDEAAGIKRGTVMPLWMFGLQGA